MKGFYEIVAGTVALDKFLADNPPDKIHSTCPARSLNNKQRLASLFRLVLDAELLEHGKIVVGFFQRGA